MTSFRIFKIEISNFQIHVDLQNIKLVHFRNSKPEVKKYPEKVQLSWSMTYRGSVNQAARLGHAFTPDLTKLKYFSKQLIGLSSIHQCH